jgi:hypothetical protein
MAWLLPPCKSICQDKYRTNDRLDGVIYYAGCRTPRQVRGNMKRQVARHFDNGLRRNQE